MISYFFVALSKYPIPPLIYSSSVPLKKGSRVIVPVRNAKRTGYVVGKASAPTFKTREIVEIIDKEPIISEKMLLLAREMAEKYASPIGEILDLFFPPSRLKGLKPKVKTNKYITLKASISNILSSHLGSRESELIEQLLESNTIEYSTVLKKIPRSTIQSLLRKDFIEIVEFEGEPPSEKKVSLNEIQKKIVQEILLNPQKPHLIYGVTGSGKTEVYFEIADKILKTGKKVLILVPEISLTPQLLIRTRARFPQYNVGIYHSSLGTSRKIEWNNAIKGKTDILLGTRSAIWVPIKDLGLIVVDEEQDESYKQYAMRPYYNAVDVAQRRAEIEEAIFVLSSATPRVETYHLAHTEKITLHEIHFRPFGKMPEISVVDMRHRKGEILSDELVREMDKTARDGNQTFLFVPKKGFSTRVQCLDCGYIFTCPNCDVALTYHKNLRMLKCHYCGHTEPLPDKCPICGSKNVVRGGVGTEKVEYEVSKIFPGLRVKRIDREEINNVESLETVLKEISQMKVDIVVGTKMITKGLDFPRVALVGVVDADHTLAMPDFRATERTFQLISQMSGRAGRGVLGRVIIQTREPLNSALRSIVSGNADDFYRTEIERRKKLDYPPFKELILITSLGKVPDMAKKRIDTVKKKIEDGPFEILGPVESPIFKLMSVYRYQLLLKCDDLPKSVDFLVKHLTQNTLGFDPTSTLKIDVQPYSTF